MGFIDLLKNELNETTTLNGDKAFKSTTSYVLDFFYRGGTLIARPNDFLDLFRNAYIENKELAILALFYLRDIRNGQGIREGFRCALKYVGNDDPELTRKLIKYVPEYGRWDDLYSLVGTEVEYDVFEFMKQQLIDDIKNMKECKSISLLAKWLKSENASSYRTKYLAKKTMKHFNMTPREYRKTLTKLRKYLKVVERNITFRTYNEIEYSQVPSKAMNKYYKAFLRNDEEHFNKFLEDLKNNKRKVNANAIYPHEVIRIRDETLQDALWRNLPKPNTDLKYLPIVDVSASMEATIYSNYEAIDIAVTIGMYLAEHNSSEFKNYFITFSEEPELIEIKGSTFKEKANIVKQSDWGLNTDISKVFNLILRTAIKNNLKQEDLPENLIILSDMQFDSCVEGYSTYEYAKELFKEHGYQLPQIVFWNLNDYGNVPVKKDEKGTVLLSGFNPKIVEKIINDEEINPYLMMLDILKAYEHILE